MRHEKSRFIEVLAGGYIRKIRSFLRSGGFLRQLVYRLIFHLQIWSEISISRGHPSLLQ